MKLLATDYDGTLRYAQDVMPEDLKSIEEWKNKGNKFVIVTGRSKESIDAQIKLFNLPCDYLITNNGGMVFDENGNVLLPYAIIGIKSLKSVKDISEALKDVKKINKMTIKMKPSNNEFGEDMSNILGGLDEKIRKRSESKLLKVTVSSPKSIQGVKKIIENTNGLAETELDVEYFCDEGLESERKSIGRISDNQISRAIDVSFPDDLRHAVSDIYRYCSDIEDLQVETPNIVDYRKYIEKKRK